METGLYRPMQVLNILFLLPNLVGVISAISTFRAIQAPADSIAYGIDYPLII